MVASFHSIPYVSKIQNYVKRAGSQWSAVKSSSKTKTNLKQTFWNFPQTFEDSVIFSEELGCKVQRKFDNSLKIWSGFVRF